MRSHTRALATTVAALVGVYGCRGCSGPHGPGESAIHFIDKAAHGVLFIPSVRDLGDHAQALLGSVRDAPGGQLLIKGSADMTRQLGFDPLTPEGEKQAGIDTSRSLAISGIARSEVLMVLPYSELSQLDATVSRLLATMGHQGTRKTTQVNGLPVVTYSNGDAPNPAFAYTTAGGFMLLAHGVDPVALAVAAAARQPAQSLESAKEFGEAHTNLGARDIYLYDIAPETPLAFRIPERTTLGLAVGARTLSFRVHAPLSPEQQRKAAEFLAPGATDLARLPSGLPIYVKGAVDWSAVLRTVEPVLARQDGDPLKAARAAFKEVGVDLDREIVGNLEPGFAFTVGIGPNADISNALQFDPRQANPFNNYMLAGVGRVKDPAKASATMTKMAAAMTRYGATVSSRQVGGGTVYTASYQLGEGLSWALRGSQLIAAGGYGDRVGAVIDDMASGKSPLDMGRFPQAARTLFASQGLVVSVDLGQLNDAVASVKTGSGLQAAGAEMARSLVAGWLKQVSALRPTVAVAPGGDGVNVDVAVTLK